MFTNSLAVRNLDSWLVGTLDNLWQSPAHRFDVDIEETDSSILLHADLPGVSKDELSIQVEDNVVSISCERKSCRESNLRQERYFGRWERAFRLESIDPERYEAVLKDGVLTLKFEKQQSKKFRKIEVKSG